MNVRGGGDVWLFAILVTFAGCGLDATSPAPVTPGEVRPEMVTGEAAAALGTDGYFVLESPLLVTGQVPLDTARTQSLEFARYVTNNLLLRGVVEAGRGGYWTDPHLLVLCTRALSVVNPQLGALSIDTLPAEGQALLHRQFGLSWLVALCGSRAEPQMTVQVALDSNPVRFAGGSALTGTSNLLSAFSPHGVPLDWPDALPISLERAVRFVWDALGVRIAEVPDLFVRGDYDLAGIYILQAGSARSCNRWRVVLEHDTQLRSGPAPDLRTTREVWVGARSCAGTDHVPLLQVPVPGQLTNVAILYTDFSVSPKRDYSVTVPVVAPIRFEVASRVVVP